MNWQAGSRRPGTGARSSRASPISLYSCSRASRASTASSREQGAAGSLARACSLALSRSLALFRKEQRCPGCALQHCCAPPESNGRYCFLLLKKKQQCSRPCALKNLQLPSAAQRVHARCASSTAVEEEEELHYLVPHYCSTAECQ